MFLTLFRIPHHDESLKMATCKQSVSYKFWLQVYFKRENFREALKIVSGAIFKTKKKACEKYDSD